MEYIIKNAKIATMDKENPFAESAIVKDGKFAFCGAQSEAEKLGWQSNKGNLWDVAYGSSIGGDRFGNREGLLPKASGRQYYECDIDTNGKNSRGAKRIVFSNDGLIYYTDDHYESFQLLYGEP